MIGLNCGSGQRPFDHALGWVNIDIQDQYAPDLVMDWNDLSMFETGTVDLVVSHHSLEHVGCGEGDGFIREAYRVLKPGGSLLLFVPDMRALAQRWLVRAISDQIYFTNVYGAYLGNEADRHRWGYTWPSLHATLSKGGFSGRGAIGLFDWRVIPGADIARDWWILGVEAVR